MPSALRCCLQATFALKGETCESAARKLGFTDKFEARMGNVLALAMIQDMQRALVAAGWPAAAPGVVALRSPCADFNVSGGQRQLPLTSLERTLRAYKLLGLAARMSVCRLPSLVCSWPCGLTASLHCTLQPVPGIWSYHWVP
jgi:hypothetical protein